MNRDNRSITAEALEQQQQQQRVAPDPTGLLQALKYLAIGAVVGVLAIVTLMLVMRLMHRAIRRRRQADEMYGRIMQQQGATGGSLASNALEGSRISQTDASRIDAIETPRMVVIPVLRASASPSSSRGSTPRSSRSNSLSASPRLAPPTTTSTNNSPRIVVATTAAPSNGVPPLAIQGSPRAGPARLVPRSPTWDASRNSPIYSSSPRD